MLVNKVTIKFPISTNSEWVMEQDKEELCRQIKRTISNEIKKTQIRTPNGTVLYTILIKYRK